MLYKQCEKSLAPFDSAIYGINLNLKQVLQKIPDKIKLDVQELRLRVNRPIILQCSQRAFFVTKTSEVVLSPNENLLKTTQTDIMQTFHNICNYSVYSHQNDIKNGFVTMRGGHRVGICGTAVLNNFVMTGVKDISSLNIRVAREIKGAANELLGKLNNNINGLLIVGAPSSGKTTLLRDLARQVSLNMKKVAVIDERGELGATFSGMCQNDLGLCDVLNGYSKSEGIMQALRSLSPDLIICDEIGNSEDILALERGVNSGVGIVASIHAGSMEELKRKKQIKEIIATGAFQRAVILENSNRPCVIRGVYRVGDGY